jgi:hypothetical protein
LYRDFDDPEGKETNKIFDTIDTPQIWADWFSVIEPCANGNKVYNIKVSEIKAYIVIPLGDS